ncbi:Uncharacterized protein Rs2_23107 [Raphanus sativus]|nr:Uncharacterized protein Rs2_23107 [Raphanus sativus]
MRVFQTHGETQTNLQVEASHFSLLPSFPPPPAPPHSHHVSAAPSSNDNFPQPNDVSSSSPSHLAVYPHSAPSSSALTAPIEPSQEKEKSSQEVRHPVQALSANKLASFATGELWYGPVWFSFSPPVSFGLPPPKNYTSNGSICTCVLVADDHEAEEVSKGDGTDIVQQNKF